MNLTVDINFNINVSDSLVDLLKRSGLLASRSDLRVAAAHQRQCQECQDKPQPPVAAEPQPPVAAEPETAPEEAPSSSQEIPAPEGKVYHGKDFILEVIDATRRRIQGDDYETSEDPRVKKLGKALTAEFKNIAMQLAASMGDDALGKILEKDKSGKDVVKPTRLPEIGIDLAFRNSCDELYEENGELKVREAF